jgi:transketolase
MGRAWLINTELLAKEIRIDVLKILERAKASHIGSCYSCADILAVLYGSILKIDITNPKCSNRDRFILSKGHAAAALYATLSNIGMFPKSELETYGRDGSLYMAHSSHQISGVEFSSGSLGHGLSFSVGKAIAAKRKQWSWRVFTLLGDGELDEGSNWEALMFAAHHKLDNLTAVIDYNNLQSFTTVNKTLGLEPLLDKFIAFGWEVVEVDGHDHDALAKALSSVPWKNNSPSLLLAHTVKGKGVSFMENKVEWHYKSPNSEQAVLALKELEGH